MPNSRPLRLAVGLLLLGAAFSPCDAALLFSFSYSFGPAPGYATTISASGTITTEDTPQIGGGYRIVSITGTRTLTTSPLPAVQEAITGLLPIGTYAGNQNLLYFPTAPFLDYDGMAFTVDNLFGGDDGTGQVNVYFDPAAGSYTENLGALDYGDFTIAPITQGASVPEPGSGLLLGTGLIALSAFLRSRTRKRS